MHSLWLGMKTALEDHHLFAEVFFKNWITVISFGIFVWDEMTPIGQFLVVFVC